MSGRRISSSAACVLCTQPPQTRSLHADDGRARPPRLGCGAEVISELADPLRRPCVTACIEPATMAEPRRMPLCSVPLLRRRWRSALRGGHAHGR